MRMRNPASLAKAQATREANYQIKLGKFDERRDNLPDMSKVVEVSAPLMEASLRNMKNELGVNYSHIDGKLYYIDTTGRLSTNWTKYKAHLGRNNPWYYSPVWSMIQNYNRLTGATEKMFKHAQRGESLSDMMQKSHRGSILRARNQARYLRNRPDKAAELFERMDARREFRNTRSSYREQYLRELAKIVI